MSAAPLYGLPDRFLPKRLACVNRDIEILSLNIMKRVNVFFRRKSSFLARQVESDDTPAAKIDGKLRHFF